MKTFAQLEKQAVRKAAPEMLEVLKHIYSATQCSTQAQLPNHLQSMLMKAIDSATYRES